MLPLSAREAHSTPADHAKCRHMLKVGSLSFHAAAQQLPLNLRDAVTTFYAFCRLADDSIDHSRDKHRSLERLNERLDACYAGKPLPQPVDRAFADLVRSKPVSRPILDLLLDGFRWDCEERFYASISDVRAYSVRVASTVGAVVALLLGVRDRDTLERACSLGIAMQLTNIARDVGEDANANRLYLPTDWLIEAGIDPQEFLRTPAINPGIRSVTKRLLDEADIWYRHADPGIARLPRGARPSIFAARYIYAEIGRVVRSTDYDSVSDRAIVTKMRKTALLGKSYARTLTASKKGDGRGAPEAQGLVDLALEAGTEAGAAPDLSDRIIWALSIIAQPRNKRRKRARHPLPPAGE